MNYSELNDLYSNRVFINGKCPYYNECKMKKRVCDSFNYARVGKDYLKSKTRIMFVGKEAIEAHNSIIEPSKIECVRNNNKHYLGLYYTAVLLLNGEEPHSFSKDDLTGYTGLESKYCLTNYFKCAFKNGNDESHGIHVNKKMREHCPELFANEIRLLKPDIVIVQGKFSDRFFWGPEGTIHQALQDGVELMPEENGITLEKYKYKDNGRMVYFVWSYHPAGSQFYNERSIKSFKKALSLIPNTNYYQKELQSL